jgi:hypothetical protein
MPLFALTLTVRAKTQRQENVLERDLNFEGDLK